MDDIVKRFENQHVWRHPIPYAEVVEVGRHAILRG